jgi:hypothetical protein
VLWLKITEGEAKSKYEKEIVPDLSRYYVKDYPYYAATNYPEFNPGIEGLFLLLPPTSDVPAVYKCDLCNKILESSEELSKHVKTQH